MRAFLHRNRFSVATVLTLSCVGGIIADSLPNGAFFWPFFVAWVLFCAGCGHVAARADIAEQQRARARAYLESRGWDR